MLNYKKKDLGKSTFSYRVVIDKNQLHEYEEQVFKELWDNLEVEGFRRGKAPKEVAKKNITHSDTFPKAINKLLPEIYKKLLEEEKIHPIINPRIDLVTAKPDTDLEVDIKVALRPNIALGEYKQYLAKIKKTTVDDKIKPLKTEDNKANIKGTSKENALNIILDTLLKETNIDISELIIEAEIENRLAKLVDDVSKVGLTMEAYLSSKGETQQSLRDKLTREITDIYKLEFILEEVANLEKIAVTEKDLETLFSNIKDETARSEAKKNSYFYASLARRQKTIDFLMTL